MVPGSRSMCCNFAFVRPELHMLWTTRRSGRIPQDQGQPAPGPERVVPFNSPTFLQGPMLRLTPLPHPPEPPAPLPASVGAYQHRVTSLNVYSGSWHRILFLLALLLPNVACNGS